MGPMIAETKALLRIPEEILNLIAHTGLLTFLNSDQVLFLTRVLDPAIWIQGNCQTKLHTVASTDCCSVDIHPGCTYLL
jgi:hypothetical protein